MSTCASCEGELRPEWKFCVWCGAAVEAAEAIPAAIRPEAELSRATAGPPKARAKVTFVSIPPLLFSVTCFAIAGLVITWLAINVWF